jgi:hypothetical protein
LNALKNAGIFSDIAGAENLKEIRGYVFITLLKTEQTFEGSAKNICEDPQIMLACSLGTSNCPAECVKQICEKDLNILSCALNTPDCPAVCKKTRYP